jgi:hypothetical protein
LRTNVRVKPGFVGMEPRLCRQVIPNDIANGFLVGRANVERFDAIVPLHKGDDDLLVRTTSFATSSERPVNSLRTNPPCLAFAVVSFVRLGARYRS